ncbi:hypothetical protein PMAYCL1PPCAC_27685, partial [Pristionchus mayeri]
IFFRMRSALALILLAALVCSTPINPVVQTGDSSMPINPIVQTGDASIKNGLFCDVCKDIVDDVENHKEDSIEADVNATIEKFCNRLGFLAGECIKVMEKVEELIMADWNQNYSPDQLCQMADIC